MTKRLIDVLRMLAKELIEKGYDSAEALKKISLIDIDFFMVKDELCVLENSKLVDEAELDIIRALLIYILIKDSELDIEDIYAFIFGNGRQIIWN
ncbi:MAG: hypothetical protein C0415_05755 [Thermodesulfovibrio sp.]|nr:hypothetical protein [Thermodesulfovibrio sp.]